MALALSRKTQLIASIPTTSVPSGLNTPSEASSEKIAIVCSGLPNFNINYTSISRDILKDSFSGVTPIRGIQECTGSLNVELKGAQGANYVPSHHPLLYSAFGSVSVASTTTSASATVGSASDGIRTVTLTLTSTTGLKTGYALTVYSGTTIKTIGRITTISGSDVTLACPENLVKNASIASGDNVTTGAIYTLLDSSDLPDFDCILYRPKSSSGYVTETYSEMLPTSLDFDLTAGNIGLMSFNLEGTSASVSTASSVSYTQDEETPIVVRNNYMYLDFTVSSTSYTKTDIASLKVSLKNDLYKKFVVSSSGASDIARISRSVEAGVNLYYEDEVLYNALINDVTAKLTAFMPQNYNSLSLGKTCYLHAPSAKFVSTPVSDDNGVAKYDVNLSLTTLDSAGTNDYAKEIVLQVL